MLCSAKDLLVPMSVFLFSLTTAGLLQAEEKAMAPPAVLLTLPLAVERGKPAKVTLRGLRLETASAVHIAGDDAPPVAIQSKDKANVPNGTNAAKVGDTQVVVEFTVPAETTAKQIELRVMTDAGETEPIAIPVYAAGQLIEEVEPNDGFEQAQPVALGQTILGTIQDARNVDVFRFSAAAGQTIEAAVFVTPLHSSLDSSLTLFTASGRLLAYADDAPDSRDARLRVTLPESGDYFLVIGDAQDTGAATHVYRLRLAAM